MMNKKERKACLEVLSHEWLAQFLGWSLVPGTDEFGPFHLLPCGGGCWLSFSIGIHPDLDQVSPRVGWQTNAAQPARAQDPTVRGTGTLEAVRRSGAPVEFMVDSFSTPLGKLISRGFVKVYEVMSVEVAPFAVPEIANDMRMYAFPYFQLYLQSKGLPGLEELMSR